MCLPYTRSLNSSSAVMSDQNFTLIAEKGFAECIHAADVSVMSKFLTGRLKLDACWSVCEIPSAPPRGGTNKAARLREGE